jgi:dolichyl-phosphate-mannose--protein O-mannosyl transferase
MTALLVIVLYFPWFAASRTSFLYYMTPVAPFMAILVASAISLLAGDRLDPHPSFAGRRAGTSAADAGDALAGPAPPHAQRHLLLDLELFLIGAVGTPLLWHPLAVVARSVFWTTPRHLSPAAGLVGVAIGCALGLAALAVSCLVPSARRVWPRAGWLYVGIVAGICITLLPVVIDIGITPAHYYRLMWFPRWI